MPRSASDRPPSAPPLSRRACLGGAIQVAAGALTVRGAAAPAAPRKAATPTLVGVQLGAHSVFDEGPDRCLDLLQSTLGANAVFVYSHTYHPVGRPPPGLRAPDHGVPFRSDPRGRPLTRVWTPPHEEFYRNTPLRHVREPARQEYADRDVFAALLPAARRRGIKVFARSLEGSVPEVARSIPGFARVLGVDLFGRRHPRPCWNHPDYRAFWLATVEDLVKSHPIDGLMLGPERGGPLDPVLFKGDVPSCFCEHCRARARSRGIDPERARTGFAEIYNRIKQAEGGAPLPSDGLIVTLLRTVLRYPEVLAWEQQEHESKEGLAREMYGAAKLLRPSLHMGWHIAHFTTTWNVLHRAEMDYAELATYSDFLKPCVYFDASGPRVADWLQRVGKRVFRELTPELTLAWLYAVSGFDPRREPGVAALPDRGFSESYVAREVRRCVDGVGGRVPVYAGIGVDIPHGDRPIPADPDKVYRATRAAFDAGARGVLLSREYDEMRLDSLRAVGRAVRDAGHP